MQGKSIRLEVEKVGFYLTVCYSSLLIRFETKKVKKKERERIWINQKKTIQHCIMLFRLQILALFPCKHSQALKHMKITDYLPLKNMDAAHKDQHIFN